MCHRRYRDHMHLYSTYYRACKRRKERKRKISACSCRRSFYRQGCASSVTRCGFFSGGGRFSLCLYHFRLRYFRNRHRYAPSVKQKRKKGAYLSAFGYRMGRIGRHGTRQILCDRGDREHRGALCGEYREFLARSADSDRRDRCRCTGVYRDSQTKEEKEKRRCTKGTDRQTKRARNNRA